jgi:hypothetical protein
VLDTFINNEMSAAILAHRTVLEDGERDYLAHAVTGNWSAIPATVAALKPADETNLRWAYDNRLSQGAGRDIYLKIKGTGKCHSCLQRNVEQLDHFLPKELYARFAISPLNLVPICEKCNHIKRTKVGGATSQWFLNPYFDDLGDSTWLVADVTENDVATLTYRVNPRPNWTSIFAARVLNHFDLLELAKLYALEAASSFSGLHEHFETTFNNGGDVALRQELQSMASSMSRRAERPWEVAAARAWAASTWFCNAGWVP